MPSRRASFGIVSAVIFVISNSAHLANANDGIGLYAMPEDEFWSLIELVEGSGWTDEETNLIPLVETLSAMSVQSIEGFFETLAQKLFALDTRAHYQAFTWFPGRSDTFLYTRLAVVAQGRTEYQRILENPRFFPGSSSRWLEGLLYVADDAYRSVTGLAFQRASSVNFESGSNDIGWQR